MQQKEADLARQAEELRSRLKSKLTSAEDSLAHNPFTKKEAGDRSEDFELKKGIPVIKEGTIVHVTSLNNDCTVLRKPDKDGNVLIQAGLMKINVHYSNLEPVRTKINSNSDTKHSSKNISTKSRDFKPEIDLRGEMVDDAIFMLDKYLDDASLAGVKQVSVIHGKGTGALRAGVHSFLKGNRHVKSFRLGTLGEGDTGVTIVEVK